MNPAQTVVRLVEKRTARYHQYIPVSYFGHQLQIHYERSKHHKCTNPQIDDVYVLKIYKLYQRVVITRLISPDLIEVKQLDYGADYQIVKQDELLICDEEFKDEPFEAYDLRITGLAPFNMERVWPNDTKKLVRNKFFNMPAKKNLVFTADIDFRFQDLIFVKNIYSPSGNDLNSFLEKHTQIYTDSGVHMRLKICISDAKSST